MVTTFQFIKSPEEGEIWNIGKPQVVAFLFAFLLFMSIFLSPKMATSWGCQKMCILAQTAEYIRFRFLLWWSE